MSAITQQLMSYGSSLGGFPSYLDATTTSFGSSGTTRAVNMPATVSAGDLLIVQLGNDSGTAASVTVFNAPAGWQRFDNSTPPMGAWWFYKKADGTEDGTTVNFVGSTAQNSCVAICHRIQAGSWNEDAMPESVSNLQTANTAPDPPSLTPTWGAANTLWLAAFFGEDNGAVTAYPYASGNTHVESNSGSSADTYSEAASCYTTSNTATLSPGTFTKTPNDDSVAFTVGIRPTSAADGFPAYLGNKTTIFGSDTTQHLVRMPDTVSAGDLLIVQLTVDGTPTITTPGAWAAFAPYTGSGHKGDWYWLQAAGTEGGTTVDFVTSASEQAVAIVHRIKAGTWATATAPEAATYTSGTSLTPNPPSLTPSWGAANTLWIAGYGADNTGLAYIYPFTMGGQTLNSADRGGGALGNTSVSAGSCATKLNAASLDPGTFSKSTSTDWRSTTIAVRPA